MIRRITSLLALLLVTSACYHATIETGATPSAQTITNKWASGWLGGLVSPSTVQTMERCPNGVARVETRLSFLNGLVNALTGGIFTPMEITVTCAAGGGDDADLEAVTTPEELQAALESGEPFLVDLR